MKNAFEVRFLGPFFMYLLSQSKFTPLVGSEIKSMLLIFKTEMLSYQSKANLDEETLFGKITHHLDPEIRKMLVKSMFRNDI